MSLFKGQCREKIATGAANKIHHKSTEYALGFAKNPSLTKNDNCLMRKICIYFDEDIQMTTCTCNS